MFKKNVFALKQLFAAPIFGCFFLIIELQIEGKSYEMKQMVKEQQFTHLLKYNVFHGSLYVRIRHERDQSFLVSVPARKKF